MRRQYIIDFKVDKTFSFTFHTAKHFSTLLSVILRFFIKYESHVWRASCFWTVSFSDFEKWRNAALKTFNNYTRVMTSNSDKIRILWVVFLSVTYFWVNSSGALVKFIFKIILKQILKGKYFKLLMLRDRGWGGYVSKGTSLPYDFWKISLSMNRFFLCVPYSFFSAA